MSLEIAIHKPTKAEATEFTSGGKRWGCVRFSDGTRGGIDVYTTPAAARAVADAFNSAMAPVTEEAAE